MTVMTISPTKRRVTTTTLSTYISPVLYHIIDQKAIIM